MLGVEGEGEMSLERGVDQLEKNKSKREEMGRGGDESFADEGKLHQNEQSQLALSAEKAPCYKKGGGGDVY